MLAGSRLSDVEESATPMRKLPPRLGPAARAALGRDALKPKAADAARNVRRSIIRGFVIFLLPVVWSGCRAMTAVNCLCEDSCHSGFSVLRITRRRALRRSAVGICADS